MTIVARLDNPHDWTWLLRVPVPQGEPVPMQLWFLWHAHTLMPLREAERCPS